MAIVHQIGRDPAEFGEICNNDGRGVCERISRVGALRRHRLSAPRQRDRRDGADQWSRGARQSPVRRRVRHAKGGSFPCGRESGLTQQVFDVFVRFSTHSKGGPTDGAQ
jgi:hypothetical protein